MWRAVKENQNVAFLGWQQLQRQLHTTPVTNSKYRYKLMDGTPFVNKNKQAKIRLMEPNKEACKRFWWKEDGSVWHWPRSDHGYFNDGFYKNLKNKPVRVSDPLREKMVKDLMGPYHIYRQSKWFRHDNDYEKPSTTLLSREFLGLPPKS